MKANIIVLFFFFVVATATPNVEANDVEVAAERARVEKAKKQLEARKAREGNQANQGNRNPWNPYHAKAAEQAAEQEAKAKEANAKANAIAKAVEKEEKLQKKLHDANAKVSTWSQKVDRLDNYRRRGNVVEKLSAVARLPNARNKLSKYQKKVQKLRKVQQNTIEALAGLSAAHDMNAAFPEHGGTSGAAAGRSPAHHMNAAFPEHDEKRRNISIAAGLSALAVFSIAAIALICWTLKKEKGLGQKQTVSVESSLAAGGNS